MNRLKLTLGVLVLGLLLAACGDGGGRGAATGNLQVAISGLPSEASANVSVSGPNGYGQTLGATTTLSNIAVGSYTVTAGNVTVGSAAYTATVTGSPASVTADQTARVGVAYAISGGGGGDNNTFAGTVYAPSGGDVAGTIVGACPVSNNTYDCGAAGTVTTTVSSSGASATYSITAQAGQSYAVIAQKDVNGDGQLDGGDYQGGYPDFDNLQAVTPPQSGIDIHMSVVGGGGGTKPAISNFSANPANITAGQSSTLSWSVTGATSLAINGGVGDVTGKTSVSVSPTMTTTYTLTATNSAGSSTATATVTVTGGGGGNPSVTFLKPSDFQNGTATVTLSNLGTDENVAVIPVYATQDLSPDGMDYSIGVSGITPAALPPSLAPQALSPRQQRALKMEQNHLKQLAKSTEEVNALLKAGVKPLSSGELRTQSIGKCPAPYSAGSTQCSFWISAGSSQTQITATLEYESANAYWFVQDSDLSDLSQSDLQNLAQVFEDTIAPSDNRYFGPFPDVDGNGKIFIVFSHLLYPAGLLGYVYPVDLFPDSQTCPDPGNANTCVHSNEGDIFYATTPSSDQEDTRTQYFQAAMPSTMVHELKHLIAAGIRAAEGAQQEELWIEEASAVSAEELAGLGSQIGRVQPYARYGLAAPQDFRVVYQGRPGDFESGLGIYGYNFLLIWHLAEEVGFDNFWKAWTAGPGTGIANLEAHSGGRTFPDMMEDWAVTLLLDHTNQAGTLADYSYQNINLRDGTWEDLGYQPLTDGISDTTRSLAYYIGKGQGGDATITISSSASAPYAVVVRYGTALSWSPRDGSMSGTVYAPSGGDVNGATLEACYVESGGQCNENSANTFFGTINQSGSSASYSISEMHYGSYLVYAFQDINNDGTLDAGDSYNCYTTDNVHCATVNVNPNASGIDVYMVTLTSQALSTLPTLRAFPRRSNLHPLEGNPALLFKH